METRASSGFQDVTAFQQYDTSVPGEQDGYYVPSNGNYRGYVVLDLCGVIDASAGGSQYSYLEINLRLYYYSGSTIIVGSSTTTYTTGSFNGATQIIYTSFGSVNMDYRLHMKMLLP